MSLNEFILSEFCSLFNKIIIVLSIPSLPLLVVLHKVLQNLLPAADSPSLPPFAEKQSRDEYVNHIF
jgi:uncharacterized membrane protein